MNKYRKTAGMIFAIIISLGFGVHLVSAGDKLQSPDGKITIEGKKPAQFNHQTHIKLGIACGSCHHDASHNPLTAEAIGEMPDGSGLLCANCHTKDFKNEKLQKRKDIFHARCQGCHKEGIEGKKGPTKCTSCHIKKEKKKTIEGC